MFQSVLALSLFTSMASPRQTNQTNRSFDPLLCDVTLAVMTRSQTDS